MIYIHYATCLILLKIQEPLKLDDFGWFQDPIYFLSFHLNINGLIRYQLQMPVSHKLDKSRVFMCQNHKKNMS